MCLIHDGQFDAARRSLAEGLEVATRIQVSGALIYGNWMLGELARWQGEYEQAVLYGQRSLETALPLEPFMPFMTVQPLGSLGAAYLDISEHFSEQAAELHQHALRLLESPAGVGGGGSAWADVGFCALALGDLEIAEASFQKGLHVPTLFMRLERPRHLAGMGLVALRRGRSDEALKLVQEGWAYAADRAMQHLYPFLALTLGHVHARRHEWEQASAQFERATVEARGLGMLPIVWQAEVGAAQALTMVDHSAEAAARRRDAAAIIGKIADRFRDPALRERFVSAAQAKLHQSEPRSLPSDALGAGLDSDVPNSVVEI
jgi:tetratricopeptide (TPR) repeat protein